MGRATTGLIVLVLVLAIGGTSIAWGTPEISGEWETTVQAECADACAVERQALTFEVRSSVALDVDYDALTLSATNLWGLRGLLEAGLTAEVDIPIASADVVVDASITLAPPLDDEHRIPPGDPLLVRSRLDTDVSTEGVGLTLGIVHDDVNFEDRDASMARYGPNDQRFQAGGLVELDGETASEVELNAVSGFCLDPDDNADMPVGSLSDDVCESGSLNWTRTVFEIADLPLHPSVGAESELNCEPVDTPSSIVCELEAELTATSVGTGIQAASVEWDYDAVYPDRELDEVVVALSHEANIEAELTLDGTLLWDELNVEAERSVHRGDAVLSWTIDGAYERTEGLTDIALEGGIERGPLELGAEFKWEQSTDRLRFDALSIQGAGQFGSLSLASQFDIDPDGLDDFKLKSALEF